VDATQKKKEEEKKLRKACTDFEAFFVYYMLKTMRETVPKNSLMGQQSGRDSYHMMLDQQIAQKVASRGEGLGSKRLFSMILIR